MFKHTLLFAALAGALPAQAQRDYFGRDVGAGRNLPPVVAVVPAPSASPSPARGAPFTLLPFQTQATGSRSEAVAIGDITGDARADVVLTTAQGSSALNDYRVFVFPQTATGSLISPSRTPYGQIASSNGLALGNFDGVAGLDVAVGGEDGVSLLHATGSAPWLSLDSVLTGLPATAIARLDLDGAGRDDLAAASWNSGGMLYVADDKGGYDASVWAVTLAGYNSIATGDVDGDGVADVATSSWGGGQPSVRVNRNNGDGTLSEIGSLEAGCEGWNPHGIGIGELTGDGINDIIVSAGGNLPSSCLQLFPGLGGGKFGAAQTLPSHDIPETLVVADIDRDGRADVIVVHGGWQALGVYLQQPGGGLAAEQRFPIPYASHYGTQGLAVGDFSGDGCPDVAIADYNSGLVTLKNGMDCDSLFANGFE